MARSRRDGRSIAEREALLQPAFSYRILPVRGLLGEALDLGETTLRVPGFASDAGKIEAVAAAACTIGPALGARVSQLFAARRPSLALALDRLGTEALFRVADRAFAAIQREARQQGLRTGAQASPGDPGIALDQQAAVIAAAAAGKAGVTVTARGMLSPEKSRSFLVSLGRDLPAPAISGRCARCPSRDRCPLR